MCESRGAIVMEKTVIPMCLCRAYGAHGGVCGGGGVRRGIAMLYRATTIVAALSVAALPAVAGDTSQWSRVQRLDAGHMIAVDLSDQRHVECRFVRASEIDFTYETSREITVSRDAVVGVYQAPRLRRWMKTLLGAAIGLGAGEIVNGTLGRYFHNEGHDITAVTLGSGAAAGAAIGALTGGGYKTVYRRPSQR
jgi:hypothetical protein